MLQRGPTFLSVIGSSTTIGPPILDLDAAPYGGARYPVEARMDARIFARFHLDVGIGDVVMQPLEVLDCRDWLGFAGIERCRGPDDSARTAVRRKAPRLHTSEKQPEQSSEGFGGSGAPVRIRWT